VEIGLLVGVAIVLSGLVYITANIREGVIQLMSDQDKLNADVAALLESLTNIEAEIASLKAQPGAQALDFSGLDAVVARAKGDETTTTPTPTTEQATT
jgi:hypothetical protein